MIEVYGLLGEGVTERVFPESRNIHEKYRAVSHGLAAAQGDGPPQKLVVSNMHVVSGQKRHKVPGKHPRQRTVFKMRQVTSGMEKAELGPSISAGATTT